MANKQIQVSSVKQMADVEVIFVNASIISKAIRSSITAHNALDKCVSEEPILKSDDNGAPVMENGEPVVVGTNKSYSRYNLREDDLRTLYENVLPFIDELCKAFES